jgi:hypothetical protein
MNPKTFISYSWSNPEHEAWVLRLATELRESSVDVVLDKWDLKEGHDAHAFMEQMVTDPDVKKVVMICDRVYTEKANGRLGGVGIETQIITPEIYDNIKQDKFVAVVAERDADGKIYIPNFYKSRIHIDLSDATIYSNNFDQLLRWIFDKPLHIKPPLGDPPSFLKDTQAASPLQTSARFRRANEMVRNGHAAGVASAIDYFDALAGELEKLRLKGSDHKDNFDDVVMASIESFIPHRNEVLSLFEALTKYAPEQIGQIAHSFLEKIYHYTQRPENLNSWQTWDFDNYKFIAQEMFLHIIAIFIKSSRYEAAAYLMDTEYYVPRTDSVRRGMRDFSTFMFDINALEFRNKRLNARRLSIVADIVKERCVGLSTNFHDLMQADFVLFVHASLMGKWWIPRTLVYSERFDDSAFEIFARAKSKVFFGRIKVMLGNLPLETVQQRLNEIGNDSRRLPHWDWHTVNLLAGAGVADLGTRP